MRQEETIEMIEMMNGKMVQMAILAGEYDEDLDHLVGAITSRKELVAEMMTAELREGSRVKTGPRTRPRFLANLTGTVTGFEPDRIRVEWDAHFHHYDSHGRDRLRGTWRMHKTSVMPITDEEEAA